MNVVEKSGLCLFILGAVHYPSSSGWVGAFVSVVMLCGFFMFFWGKRDD